jgi:hypothetical protein
MTECMPNALDFGIILVSTLYMKVSILFPILSETWPLIAIRCHQKTGRYYTQITAVRRQQRTLMSPAENQ